jgi:hypothetical protein
MVVQACMWVPEVRGLQFEAILDKIVMKSCLN